MTTETRKQFNITVVEEKYYSFLHVDQIAEKKYMKETQFHAFKAKGTSDDPEIQRFENITSSVAITPEPSDLIVTKVGKEYHLERFPCNSGHFVATVMSATKSFVK